MSSTTKCSISSGGSYNDDNYAHFMCFEENDNFHGKISLFDLLPMEIIKLNRKKYDPLVIGFIKQCEKRH